MIKVLIIEDERLIAEELSRTLQKISNEIEIIKIIPSVTEGVQFLSTTSKPDLIFSDVQLADGTSFDIFNSIAIKVPVIFITGYDNFIVNAFEHNGIDYLLKPVDEKDLVKALAKYRSLENHFNPYQPFVNSFLNKPRTRIIVRRGIENIVLKVEDIVVAYTESKIVYVVDQEGRKYLSDRNLSDLFQQLDNRVFFRANRQYIVNIAFVKSYKTFEKVKLQVDLTMSLSNHHIVVSQEMAPDFRKWMSGD
ncbi:MAG: response regulator transcription factor [Chitinophagaceae bacterium]|nr:response regulator transcription factor [Chitinophagaceae bacterium]